jgi:hypothetical protein
MSKLRGVPASRPSPLVQLVGDYLADMKARGLSPKTIKNSVGWHSLALTSTGQVLAWS